MTFVPLCFCQKWVILQVMLLFSEGVVDCLCVAVVSVLHHGWEYLNNSVQAIFCLVGFYLTCQLFHSFPLMTA